MSDQPRNEFSSPSRTTVAPLRKYPARMPGNRTDAQNVAHGAYRRVYQAMDTQGVEKPEAFLDAGRNVIELAASDAPGVERVVMCQEWARLEAAGDLPAGWRTVLQLCKMEGFSHAEIGARLNIAISTVEKQHARALRLLRAQLHADATAPDEQTEPRVGCAANGR